METIMVLLCILSAAPITYAGMGLPPGAPPGFTALGKQRCRVELPNKCLVKGLWLLFSDDDEVDQPCNMAKRTACLFHGGGNHPGPTYAENTRGPGMLLKCDEGKLLKSVCSVASESIVNVIQNIQIGAIPINKRQIFL